MKGREAGGKLGGGARGCRKVWYGGSGEGRETGGKLGTTGDNWGRVGLQESQLRWGGEGREADGKLRGEGGCGRVRYGGVGREEKLVRSWGQLGGGGRWGCRRPPSVQITEQ